MKIYYPYKSDKKDKKYYIITITGNRVYFGTSGYEDYTTHKDIKRREVYSQRHEKNEDWKDPLTPGALSRWILWNKKSLKASIADFKKRFNL
jgi:hypothetical protein